MENLKLTKEENIEVIKRIITEWGGVTSGELELDASPCINSSGTHKNHICTLVEGFYVKDVTTVTYHNEMEIAEDEISYEDLSDDILTEIRVIIENYEKEMIEENK